tara:strand:- start:173 stop:379 length:207 start_codon:yes stop_codon:yes gene_type:complete
MAYGMTEMGKLPVKVQEEILERLSNTDTNPIEIDGEVFIIPTKVNGLIEYLYKQLQEKDINGISQNPK